jgi:hypothetical protein
MYRNLHLALAVFVALGSVARGQGLLPPPSGAMEHGGAGGLTAPFLNGEDRGIRRHVGPTGKPCLAVRGAARSETINPKLFEHRIVALNECSQRIKLQVCYYQSQHCVAMNVPPYGRDEVILGIMPSMSGFRFEFRELFDRF